MLKVEEKIEKKIEPLELDLVPLTKFIFLHLNNLPLEDVQEAVVLVSYNNEANVAFKELNKLKSEKYYEQPRMTVIEPSITIVNPTDALLRPEYAQNFVSMYYMMNLLKRAKIIFVYNQADLSDNSIKNVKQSLVRLLSLFKKEDNMGVKLSKSCGIIITEAEKMPQTYIKVLKLIYEQKSFIDNEDVKKLVKGMVTAQRLAYFKGENDNIVQFQELIKKIQPVSLSKRMNVKHQSSIEQYKKPQNNISKYWSKLFQYLYHNLPSILLTKQKRVEVQLVKQVTDLGCPVSDEGNTQLKQQYKQCPESIRLLSFLQWLLKLYTCTLQVSKIYGESLNYATNLMRIKNVVQMFLNNFYEHGYLTKYCIKYFFLSYFRIFQFLSAQQSCLDQILQAVNFHSSQYIGNSEIINENLTIIMNYLFGLLEHTLAECSSQFPFDRIIRLFNSVLKLLGQDVRNYYTFKTVRVMKKLNKFRAEFAYEKAFHLSQKIGEKKIKILEAWLNFLEYSSHSTLIDQDKKQKTLVKIADQFAEMGQYHLALKIYNRMPLYQTYQKIITIYERDMKFDPEIFKYTLIGDWLQKKKDFTAYCDFLLKIGFNQRVNQLCMIGLREMHNIKNADEMQPFKRYLLNARAEGSRDLHNIFLQCDVLEQKVVVIDEALLEEIRKKIQTQ